MAINHLDLFSGIGGFALASEMAGWKYEKSFYSDIDEYANKVYAKNFPNAVALGDITKIDYERLREEHGTEWLATGGFPCQPHSIAGKRKGSEDERDLWAECTRMLRELRPKYAVFENVAGLLISNGGRFFNRVISDISEAGYDCEWQIISAAEVGAPHLRKRIWIVAYPRCEYGTGRQNQRKPTRKNQQGNADESQRSVECDKQGITTNSNTPGIRTSEIRDNGNRQKKNGEFIALSEFSRQDSEPSDSDSNRRLPGETEKLSTERGFDALSNTSANYREEQSCALGVTKSAGLQSGINGQRENKYGRTGEWISWSGNHWTKIATRFCVLDDGLPDRVAKLKCLGNSIVPQVAVIPLRMCKEHYENNIHA